MQRESRAIPIVFTNVSDPIGSGFIASLARPGGDLTGLLLYEEGITGKWLAMLKEIAPRLERVAAIGNPKTTPYDYFLRSAEATVASLAIEGLLPSPIECAAGMERAINPSRASRTAACSRCRTAPTSPIAIWIIALAAQHRLPAVYFARLFVAAGGLMSYGTDVFDVFRQAAAYIDRILRGAAPGDLPVQAPTKYETT